MAKIKKKVKTGHSKQRNSYFAVTGNPFVDAGIYAIESFYGKDYSVLTPDDLTKKLGKIVDIYLKDGWRKNMYSIFTGNSKYSNPAIKDKRESSIKYLNSLLKDFSILGASGTCAACGRRNARPIRRRDELPLIGSGKFVNFFAGASDGERFCSVCTFAVQFMPITLYSIGGRFLLIHSVSGKIMRYWANVGMQNIRAQISLGNYTGCMQEGYKNSQNALFHIIEKVIREVDDIFSEENPSITAYLFSNYGQNPPPMQIIHLPNNVFRFLVKIQHNNYSAWREVVNKGFGRVKSEKLYKVRDNKVYKNLLAGKSIVRFFINDDRSVVGDWNIFSYYLKEVLKMDEKRIETIKKTGDKIWLNSYN